VSNILTITIILVALVAFALAYRSRIPLPTQAPLDPTVTAYYAAIVREISHIRRTLDQVGVPAKLNNPLMTSDRVQILADTAVADRDALNKLTIYLDQNGAPDELHGRALSPKERVHYLLTKQKVQR
jgi:hypothetical protein